MPRSTRKPSATGYYHLLSRGNNRERIFHADQDFRSFLGLIYRYKRRWNWRLHHFCLMPNHVHLLAFVEEFSRLSKLMQGVLQGYERMYRKKYSHSGHLWQGRYKSIPIEEESYLLECARYIERNPVRAGLVNHPEDYPWSSCRLYVEGERSRLVDPNPMYEGLGKTFRTRRKRYREFVEGNRAHDPLIDEALLGHSAILSERGQNGIKLDAIQA